MPQKKIGSGEPGPGRRSDRLTDKQKAFVAHYLQSFNGAQAARLAGYSRGCAGQAAYETLRKQAVIDAIQEELERRAMGAGETLAHIATLARATVADVLVFPDDEGEEDDPEEEPLVEGYVNDDGTWYQVVGSAQVAVTADEAERLDILAAGKLKDRKKARDRKNARPRFDLKQARDLGRLGAVRSVTINEDGSVRLEMYNRLDALQLIGRHLALFTDKTANMNINQFAGWTDAELDAYCRTGKMPERGG